LLEGEHTLGVEEAHQARLKEVEVPDEVVPGEDADVGVEREEEEEQDREDEADQESEVSPKTLRRF
jgi:hypothetical protein